MAQPLSFLPGEHIQGVQADYKIGKLIGSGATSNVFQIVQVDQPERKLIVKVMKQAEDKEAFRLEAHLLRTWQTLAIDQPQLFRIFQTPTFTAHSFGLSVPLPVPYLVEANLSDEPFYLITEYAIGQQVIALLERNNRGLDESLVLKIGTQFIHLLHLLHTKFNRWFQDLKLENIWWDDRSQRIMVTDWNVVSQEGEVEVRRDLDRGSRFLFRLLTGVSLEAGGVQTMMGVSASGLQRRAGQRWQELTIGVRELLIRALHLNFAQRYQSSEALAQALQFLAEAWDASIEELVFKTKDSMYFEGDAQQAEWLLEIMLQDPQSGEVPFQQRIEQLAEKIRDKRDGRRKQLLAGIQNALIGGNVQLAVQKSNLFFESTQEEHSKVQGMRWRQVVRLIEQGHLQADKSKIYDIHRLLEEGKIERLVVLVRQWVIGEHFKLNKTSGEPFRTPTALRALRYDARSDKKMTQFENSTQAREQLKALRGLEQVMIALQDHDAQYAALLEACFGSYIEQIQQLEKYIFKLDGLRQRAKKLLHSQEVNWAMVKDASDALREGFYLAPGDQTLREIAGQAARFYLSSVNYWPYAVAILDATKAELEPDLIALRRMSQTIRQAKEALSNPAQRDKWIPFQLLRQEKERYKNDLIQIGKEQATLVNLFFVQLERLRIDFVNYVIRELNTDSSSLSSQELKRLREEAERILPDLPAQQREQMGLELSSWIATIERLQRQLRQNTERSPTLLRLKDRMVLYDQIIQIAERNHIDRYRKWLGVKSDWLEERRICQNNITKAEEIQKKLPQAVQVGDPELVNALYQQWGRLPLDGFERANDASDKFRRAWQEALEQGVEHGTLEVLKKIQKYLASMTDPELKERLEQITHRIRAKECLAKVEYWKSKADHYWAGEEEEQDRYAAKLALGEAMHWLRLAEKQEASLVSEEVEKAIKELDHQITTLSQEKIIQDGISINEQVQLSAAELQSSLLKQDGAENQAIFDLLVGEVWRLTLRLLKNKTKQILNVSAPATVKVLNLNRTNRYPRRYALFLVLPVRLMLLYDVAASEWSPALIDDLRYDLDTVLQEIDNHSFHVLMITTTEYPDSLVTGLQAASLPIKEGSIDYIQSSQGQRWRSQMRIAFISS